MPDFFKSAFNSGPNVAPLEVVVRLGLALVLGYLVSCVYCWTRKRSQMTFSMPTTLVLLSVLIAMVTQVVGDNVARAFSLVGALSIVRFRTIVRDTQDTAYVIFAVVVGMAVGSRNPWVAFIGLGVISFGALVMMRLRSRAVAESDAEYVLTLRVGLGQDLNKLLDGECDSHLEERRLLSLGTARQGISLDAVYQVRLRDPNAADQLIRFLNRIEGVQSVQLDRRDWIDKG